MTAAHAWHGIYGGGEPVRAHRCEYVDPMALQHWLKEEKPDVLLAEHDDLARELQQKGGLPGKLRLVTCSARPDRAGKFPFPGNYDKTREIGAEAIEKLARKVALAQRGVPENPRTTLVRGAWVGSLAGPRVRN